MPNRISTSARLKDMLQVSLLLSIALSFSMTAAAAPTLTISANPPSVTSGFPSTLTWTSTEATSCAASGDWSGIKASTGSQSVIPGNAPATRTYMLKCSGSGGSVLQSVVVSVINAPPSGTEIVSFQALNRSASAMSNVPFTFGHVFKAGQVPAGVSLAARLPSGSAVPLQVDNKATYADGSLRHAVLTARLTSLAANATQTITLVTAAAAGGTPLALSDLLASNFDAAVALNVAGTTYSASAKNLLQTTTLKQWLAGPLASEWIVGAPLKTSTGTPHPHLAAYFHVRAYGGLDRVRVDVVIENNWTWVANPQDFTYDATLTVGGVTAYSKSALTHFHHARWHKVLWWNASSAALEVLHDKTYFQDTKAVPKYAALTPTEAYLGAMISSVDPMTRGNLPDYMPATGAAPGIGPLPGWTSAYLVSMDPRAKTATLANGDGGGVYSMHFRDEITGYPPSIIAHPNLSEQDPGSYAVAASTANPNVHDSAHQPSIGYVPYLVSGDYFYLEELQFWANWNLFNLNSSYRQYEKGILVGQERAQAWSLRELGRAAAFTPDGHALKAYFNTIVNNNIVYKNALYPDNPGANKLGAFIAYYGGVTDYAAWMDDFYTWAYGHLVELGFTQAQKMRDWKAKFPVGRMGIGTNEYCYVYGTPYRFAAGIGEVANGVGVPYPDFLTFYQKNYPLESQNPCPAPSINNMIGYSYAPTGYPSNMRPALAIAVDAGASGAQAAWDRFVIGSQPDFRNESQFAVIPR